MQELSQYTVDYLVELAGQNPDEEICGLILKNQTVHPILNTAKNTAKFFEMDSMQLIEALEAFSDEKVGDKILGIYHSHPGGSQCPSTTDLSGWPPEGWRYWIIAGSTVLEWEKSGDDTAIVWAKRAQSEGKLAGTLPQSSTNGRPARS